MKIAFWSNSRRECGVTTNLACMSAMMSIAGVGKTVLLANHYNRYGGIGDILLNDKDFLEKDRDRNWNYRKSIDHLLKVIYTGADGSGHLRDIAVPLLYTSMYYLPEGFIFNKEVFNYDFSLVHNELFKILNDFADYVFVDTETNQNLSSKLILHNSDLIVVNIAQNPFLIREFFDNYSSMAEKAVFLIGKYQQELAWNYSRICYEYKIPRNKIGIIPYNMELSESMTSGRMLQFINRNFYHPSGSENSYFIKKSVEAAKMLRRNIMLLKKEERKSDSRELIDLMCQ